MVGAGPFGDASEAAEAVEDVLRGVFSRRRKGSDRDALDSRGGEEGCGRLRAEGDQDDQVRFAKSPEQLGEPLRCDITSWQIGGEHRQSRIVVIGEGVNDAHPLKEGGGVWVADDMKRRLGKARPQPTQSRDEQERVAEGAGPGEDGYSTHSSSILWGAGEDSERGGNGYALKFKRL